MEDFRVYSRDVLVGRCCGLSVWYSLYVRDDVVGFHGAIPNIYEITFSLLLSYLGQYTLYTVLFVGVGMLFFSRSEEMEHTTLLSQIDQLGVQPEKKGG